MALDTPPAPVSGSRLAPVEPRYAPLFCFALLTISCALASLVLACATPFAAFGVVAAALLALRPALLVVTAAWLVNQAIGFGAHHYPTDANTILWGFAIGAGALAATTASVAALRTLPSKGTRLVLAAALVAAYCAYEVALFAVTPFLGGAGAFTLAIIARLAFLNVIWLIGLVAACEIVRLIEPFRKGRAVST